MRSRALALLLVCAGWVLGCGKHGPQPAEVETRSQRDEIPLGVVIEPPPLPVAGDLAYLEVMLGGARPDEPVPMIVAIHGLGDEPHNFAGLFDAFPERARLILPRAPTAFEEGGWSWFPVRARDRDVESLSRGIEAAANTIANSVTVLVQDRPTVGAPIFTGFSQGGMITFAIAVHHPEITGAAVPVGGWLPPPLWPAGKGSGTAYPRILALHGTADTAVHFDTTKEAVDHLGALGFDVELKAYEGVPHVLTPDVRMDLTAALVEAVRAINATTRSASRQ
jgi:phospholipase/carboxylesterase